MELTISGYSTALFSTWYFIEELGILFDCGDGCIANLLQKSGKVKHIFITHPDRDHLTGLLQFNQLNARNGIPNIYYPKDCGSLGALEEFSKNFDFHVKNTSWLKIDDGQEIKINDELIVKAVKNGHVLKGENYVKSLSYKVFRLKRKLKDEYKKLSGNELRILKDQNIEISEEQRAEVLGYSGDTPVEDLERWKNSEILIHEATFLNNSDVEMKGNKHSTLKEVLKMVSESNVKKLILGHFSSRYDSQTIDNEIVKLSKEFKINIPIFRIHPSKTEFDILNQIPFFFNFENK